VSGSGVIGRIVRRRAALPWLALGTLLAAPLWLAYRTYRGERAGFISHPKAAAPEPATLGIPGLRAVRFGKAAELYGVYAEPTNGACVVLAHGSMSDHTSLLPEAAFLHRAGFGVLALDFPGHGQSDGVITWGEHERAALAAAFDFASSQPHVDATRLGVFGFSMGAYITAQFAASDTRARATVIAAAPPDAREHTLYEYRRWSILTQWPALLALHVSGMKLDEQVPRQVIGRIAPRQLLLVAGDADEQVPLWMARQLLEAAGEPKRLLVVPGAGHGGYTEAAPSLYPEAVVGFFQRGLL
jgi:dipeptidyl aminopeptidase/acylaminoacyl peptidase